MVGRKKKPKTCDHGSHEDRISPLPDDLISHILTHLSTCDVLRTSLLSKRWISLWERVPDLDSHSFSSFDALVIKQLEPQLQFPYLSQLSASFSVFDLKVLPIILRSCPKLKSLILDLVDRPRDSGEPKSKQNTLISEKDMIDRGKTKQASSRRLNRGLKEYRISQLPDPLICHVLSLLSTKEAVGTSILSTRWRNLWLWVHRFELSHWEFLDFNAFVSFGNRYFDSTRLSCIHNLKLTIDENEASYLTPWIDALVKSKIQHLCVRRTGGGSSFHEMPLSLYVCETLSDSVPGVVIDAPLLCSLRISDGVSKMFIVKDMKCNAKLDISFDFGLEAFDESNVSSISHIRNFLSGISRVRDMTISAFTFEELRNDEEMHPREMNQISFSSVPVCLLSSLEFVDFAIWGHFPK
ncbi:unnamed protein product [Brassica napus]|uniref:(rape) hypothetical protein n=1 Tax=Brassica napus TaxID=3708 RepID=A0A817AXQ9_BRANA|nr:unnamed protein product [Brassica napus]